MNQTSFDPVPERTDPFENPFERRRLSGESDETSSRQSLDVDATPLPVPIPNDLRRGSVTMIPHLPHVQLRSLTEPIQDGVAIDAEFTIPLTGTSDGFADSLQPVPPTFNRTFSAPLPSRVGALRHPLSAMVDPLGSHSAHPPKRQSSMQPPPLSSLRQDTASSGSTTLVSRTSSSSAVEQGDTAIRALSVELADSVQSAIQTLLHLSPPHLLDNAKEQYSGCSIQMPSTSLSALLTAMKSLNYFSANAQSLMEGFNKDIRDRRPSGPFPRARGMDFDIGELAQNVADLLGGQAAQMGIDLVLFHGDVGIKHVAVNGDPEGLGYLLSHVSILSNPLITDTTPNHGSSYDR
jgi:osomolarity two-component system response regulator SSK1